MAAKQKSTVNKRFITPEGMLSYPKLFTPELPPNPKASDKPKYGTTIVFAPGTDLSEAKKIVMAVAEEKWPGKAAAMFQSGALRSPFRKDAEEKGYAPGSVFINARSTDKPSVVSRYAGADGKPTKIEDESEIYPGVFARVSITAFAYDKAGNKGVSFGLNHVQKLRDGDRLDNRKKAEDEFEADLTEPASMESEAAPATKGVEDFI